MMNSVMGLIVHSGNTKSECMEAIQLAKRGNIEQAKEKISSANEVLTEAHHAQTALLTEEAKGGKVEVTMLLIHAQDHLMTAIEAKNLIECMIKMYKRMDKNI